MSRPLSSGKISYLEVDFDEDGDEWCHICGEDISGGESHYHCGNCNEVSSMMGHWVDGKFVCRPKDGTTYCYF